VCVPEVGTEAPGLPAMAVVSAHTRSTDTIRTTSHASHNRQVPGGSHQQPDGMSAKGDIPPERRKRHSLPRRRRKRTYGWPQVAVSTTMRPVTQMVLGAVKRASSQLGYSTGSTLKPAVLAHRRGRSVWGGNRVRGKRCIRGRKERRSRRGRGIGP